MFAGAVVNGWTVMGVWQTGANGTWKVTARKGKHKVVIVDRIRTEDLDAFDPEAFWNKR